MPARRATGGGSLEIAPWSFAPKGVPHGDHAEPGMVVGGELFLSLVSMPPGAGSLTFVWDLATCAGIHNRGAGELLTITRPDLVLIPREAGYRHQSTRRKTEIAIVLRGAPKLGVLRGWCRARRNLDEGVAHRQLVYEHLRLGRLNCGTVHG